MKRQRAAFVMIAIGGVALVWALWRDDVRSGVPLESAPSGRDGSDDELDVSRSRVPFEALESGGRAAPEVTVSNPVQARSVDDTRISGRVLGPDGAPASLANVLFVWDDRGRRREVTGKVERDGAFALEVGVAGVQGGLLATSLRKELSPAALPAVVSGTDGIELHLGWSSPITLDVRDQNERVVEHVDVWAYWDLGGHRVHVSMPGPRQHPWRLPRAPLPLVLSISTQGHAGGWFGPFEPEALGQTLVVHVHAHPRLRGRVTLGGTPVAGARIEIRRVVDEREAVLELEPDARPRSESGRVSESSVDGAFDVACGASGPHELWASSRDGSGMLALVLDGTSDMDGLAIELDLAPGAIVGDVGLPAGHEPHDVWLWVDGYGYRALEPDGSFRMPELLPGTLRMRVVEAHPNLVAELPAEASALGADGWLGLSYPSDAPGWLQGDVTRLVTVRPGETVRLDLDLRATIFARLSGRVLLDGAPPRLRPPSQEHHAVWEPNAVLESTTAQVARDDLDPEGSFVLGTEDPGDYRLKCKLNLVGPEENAWVVLDRVTLVPGTTSWELATSTGSLRILPSDDEHPLWSGPRACWDGPEGVRVFVEYSVLDEKSGERFFPCVPAGHVQLVRDLGDGRRTVVDCVVRPGETTEVRWPQ